MRRRKKCGIIFLGSQLVAGLAVVVVVVVVVVVTLKTFFTIFYSLQIHQIFFPAEIVQEAKKRRYLVSSRTR